MGESCRGQDFETNLSCNEQLRPRPPLEFTQDEVQPFLSKSAGFGALPSKTFQILSSGRPVIVSVDEGSDTWDLVENAKAGFCVPPGNPLELANAILTLKKNQGLREGMGRNGRIWVERHHSSQFAAEQFEKLLLSALSTKKP